MKVLLTGATGFLGKNLKKSLSLSHELVGVGSEWDLRRQDTCERLISKCDPDAVIHAAGSVGGIGANQENPGKFIYENLIMGTNVIHESMKQNVKRFVLLGTVCAYPKHTEVPFKEEDIWNGYPEETNAPYGIAKKALMQMVQSYHEQYGFNGVNLIPVNMYGPHDHFNLTSSHVIPALILKIHNAVINKQDEIVIWGTGNASREFLFAEDCAEAISLALEKDVSPSPINIGTGSEIKIIDLVKTIADIIGFQGIISCDESKPDGQPRRCLDTSKAKELLGFEACTDLRTGLSKTIDWFLKNRG
tara:strand:+ start:14169 stop:15080 length:912 start_codon:yes stop_codon:yes gene_type:complete